MALKQAIPLHKKKTGRGLMVCVVLIALLTVAVGTLSVYTVLTVGEQQRLLDSQNQQLTDMSAAVSQAQSELEAKQSQLEQQQSQMTEKDKEISGLQETVSSLLTQISLKKAAADSGTTTTTTTRSPEQIYQNLPAREYGDYSDKKIVALTFDDGPGPYTARLLDELKKRGVRATFFVLGSRVEDYPDLIKRMEAEGHIVGNHSDGHKNLTKLSAAGIKKEMDAAATEIEKLLGHKPEVMRCPGGNSNKKVLEYAKKAGIPVAYWTVDTRDWESRKVASIMGVAFSEDGIKSGSVVLMHDIYETTVDAAIQMVDRLKKEGYTFVTVPEMIYTQNEKVIEAGKQYWKY